MLHRFPDWPFRLHSCLEARRTREFRYGLHDCCLFAADAILAMTGTDPAASFRNSYSSRFGALRQIVRRSRQGALSAFAAAVMAQYDVPEVRPLLAARGDVVLLALPSGETLGLVSLAGEFIAAAERGWLAFPRQLALKAWKI